MPDSLSVTHPGGSEKQVASCARPLDVANSTSPSFADVAGAANTMNHSRLELEDLPALYRRAFAEYRTRALWNLRPVDNPTPEDALAITRALRTHGGMEGRLLAEQIEKICRAPH